MISNTKGTIGPKRMGTIGGQDWTTSFSFRGITAL